MMTKRPLNRIIVHYSLTTADMDIGVAEIRKWHVEERGWIDIGYHYVIRRSGKIETGRSIHEPGAHAEGHNTDSIGICMVGGIPDTNFTKKQWRSLEGLIDTLLILHGNMEVIGHRDVAQTKCPSFDVKQWWSG